MKRNQITGDLGSFERVDKPVAIAAAETVCRFAKNIPEAVLFLDMLGIIGPQPGNEKVDHKRSVPKKPTLKEREEETLTRLGVTPDEIGEDEEAS